jgi:hypothetical protein
MVTPELLDPAMYWKLDGVALESGRSWLGLLVRSRVMVGNGADAEIVGTAAPL